MANIVPPEDEEPFQYWLRFEFGGSGNPHVHGQSSVAGNPLFDTVAIDEEAQRAFQEEHPDSEPPKTWAEAEATVAEFFTKYIREKHPCKDDGGKHLYPFVSELLQDPLRAKPQTIDVLQILENALQMKQLILAS